MQNLRYDIDGVPLPSPMVQMELSIKQKHTRRHRERPCGCRGGGHGGEKDWELGKSRHKLLNTVVMNTQREQQIIDLIASLHTCEQVAEVQDGTAAE